MAAPVDRHDYCEDAKQESTNGRGFLNGNGNARMWDWAWRFLTVLFLPWMVWISFALIEIKTDVAVIKGNRFTDDDALLIWQALDNKADEDQVPPMWFQRKVDNLEEDFRQHVRENSP